MCHPDFVIPGGDFLLPYYDFDQNISLLITEDERFVYILYANDWDYVPFDEQDYNSWVKVRKEKYYEQWNIAIQKSRAYHGGNSLYV